MDDTDTLTPPESPPVVDEGTPAPQDAVAPVSEPEPLVGADTTEEPTEEAPPPTAWAGVQEVEELFDLEDVKPVLERRDQAAGDRAYELLKGHMQPLQIGREQNTARAAQSMESVDTTLKRAVEDGVLDIRAVQDVFRTHRAELAGFTGEASTEGYYKGVEQYVTFLLGSEAPAFISRLHRMRDQNYPDETFAADAKKKIVATARQEGYDEGFKKGSKTGQTAAQQQKAIKEAKDKGANLAPGSSGGKANINQLRRDYHEGKTNEYPG
ncbi:MAG: hypothetical protein V3U27_21345 [Candidatus Tectomicrobia bacterium]